jgi:hypothetical protein
LKLFLDEHQFIGNRKLKIDFFDRESKYFPNFYYSSNLSVDKVNYAKKIFLKSSSLLQESLVIFANMPKTTILEKSKKNEILSSREILFMFILDKYKTNKK